MFRFSLIWGFLSGLGYFLWKFFTPQHSDLILQDKVVLITGATGGIGRELALAFARRGSRVVLTGRRADVLEEVYKDIEPYASAVLVVPADITQEADRQRLVSETLNAFGQIDVLVNNAGRSEGGLFQENPPERIQNILDINLVAPILLTRQILPDMIARGTGAIVNVASVAARVSGATFVTYVASKHGIAGFTDGLRREIQGSGVHVMMVLPGWTRTEMVPPELATIVQQRGFTLQEPYVVAEGIVRGLVQGQEELVLGDWLIKAGILTERYFPIIHRLYWRVALDRAWIDATRKIP